MWELLFTVWIPAVFVLAMSITMALTGVNVKNFFYFCASMFASIAVGAIGGVLSGALTGLVVGMYWSGIASGLPPGFGLAGTFLGALVNAITGVSAGILSGRGDYMAIMHYCLFLLMAEVLSFVIARVASSVREHTRNLEDIAAPDKFYQ